ncbi:hypothetical protein ACQ86D_23255 [Streptomyces galilaeus]
MTSAVGALVIEVILTFAVGMREAFSAEQIPSHLAALLVGGLSGWLFELFRELTVSTARAIENAGSLQSSVEALTAKIKFQDQALGMLLESPRHNDVLTSLIKASLADNFRNVPFVGIPEYLDYLKHAIEHADGYEGVQRKPLRWYRDTGAGSYLYDLKRRHMSYKTRLFIISSEDLLHMQEDLQDLDVLGYYWGHTGDVKSYWMTVEEFRGNFPRISVPSDLALYDRQLTISYDERSQILSFDVKNSERDECKIFDALSNMIEHGIAEVKEVPRPEVPNNG